MKRRERERRRGSFRFGQGGQQRRRLQGERTDGGAGRRKGVFSEMSASRTTQVGRTAVRVIQPGPPGNWSTSCSGRGS